jgi:uncharacterized protein
MANYRFMELIGRDNEKLILDRLYKDTRSHFVAIYGRRRIGKTFLIRTHFETFNFYHTGIANADMEDQLAAFYKAILNYGKGKFVKPNSWFEAFELLKRVIAKSTKNKKVIFIDELPWLDTPRSKFLSALEYFWNSWASARRDVLLIICGSATSWIVRKIFNNKRGLHNRVTYKIKINPFTLRETQLFLQHKKIAWNDYQIVKAYMAFGGIPYYLEAIEKGKSVDQNIDSLFFDRNSLLYNEYNNLFSSLFDSADRHTEVVKILAKKNKGLTRSEIVQATSMNTGGTITKILEDLELSDFIRVYTPFGKEKRESLYQLTDAYSLFYHNFLTTKKLEKGFWLNAIDNPRMRAWSGYAYEMVCLLHINQIKKALGIEGILSEVSCWTSKKREGGAQIDLIIDRKDQVINVFEIKFSSEVVILNKRYVNELLEKLALFKSEVKTRKAVFLSLLTTYGIKSHEFSGNIQNELKMDDLFIS